MIDMLLAAPVYLLLFYTIPSVRVAEVIFILLLIAGYTRFFSSPWQGTPGMKLMKIRVQTTEGERLSWQHALLWCAVSAVVIVIVFAGMFYIQSSYDLDAIQALMREMSAAGGHPSLQQMEELERLAGMDILEFNAMMLKLFLVTMLLCLIWALSVARGSQKAGFHNWICGTRFVRS